jgi:cytochrome c
MPGDALMGRVGLMLLVAAGALAGCTGGRALDTPPPPTGGDPHRGALLIAHFGCGSCHTIPGIRSADGVVGPPLFFFSRRVYIAGELPNTPENLVRWVRDPPAVEPGTAMPVLGLDEQQARDVAAYLYTLR